MGDDSDKTQDNSDEMRDYSDETRNYSDETRKTHNSEEREAIVKQILLTMAPNSSYSD